MNCNGFTRSVIRFVFLEWSDKHCFSKIQIATNKSRKEQCFQKMQEILKQYFLIKFQLYLS